jgi:hypothetical protein
MMSRFDSFTHWFIEMTSLPGKRGKARRDWMRMPMAIAVWVVFLLVFEIYVISCGWFLIPLCSFLSWRGRRRRQSYLGSLSRQGRLLNWADVSARLEAGNGSLLNIWPSVDRLWWLPASPAPPRTELIHLEDRRCYMATGPQAVALRDELIYAESGPACLVQAPEEPPRVTEMLWPPDYYRQRFPRSDIIFLLPQMVVACTTAKYRTP